MIYNVTIQVRDAIFVNPFIVPYNQGIDDEGNQINMWQFISDKNNYVHDIGNMSIEEFILLNNTENSFVVKEFTWYNPLTWF